MNLFTALLVSVVMGLLLTENLGYGHLQISRPVFAGPIIGLIMGDLQTGLIVGGTVELMFMGVFPVGGSVPPNAQFAGMMATVLAISSGSNPEVGIALAVPIGVFAQFVILLSYNINLVIVHKADAEIDKGNVDSVNTCLWLCILNLFICWTLSSFLGAYLGSEWVSALYAQLPAFVQAGLSAASGIMPAMGMAMLLRMMEFKKFWSFLLIGYVLSAFLGMSILSISILIVGVVVAIYSLENRNDNDDFDDDVQITEKAGTRVVQPADLKGIYRRSYFYSACLNYERYQGLGYAYCMLPVLKKLYKKEEDLKEAVARNTEFFNTHLWMVDLILGITTALEEERAQGNELITSETVSATKAALMGPTAGFGDSFFKGVVVTISGAFAASLAIDGNPIAPFVFIIPCLIVMGLTRYYGVILGYKYGTQLIVKMRRSNIIDKFVSASTIVGMVVTAGLITNYVKFNLAVTLNFAGKEIILNDLVNSIIPKFFPYAITLLFYFIIKKNPKNGLYITLLLSFVIGILGKLVGIL